ncbi:MAG TPA: hypothetical protein VMJ34_23695 [Bryobacteraceae bacterium]|nr:hypothetical protein [Bryobacteraceae bacterium]
MNNPKTGRWALWLSFPLAVLLVIASGAGVFLPSVYANEPHLAGAGAVSADLMNLIVVVPVLIASAIFTLRGWMGARLVWMSTVLYVVYAFIYYTLSVRYNALFLIYCAVQGLSFYMLVGALGSISVGEIARRYRRRGPAFAAAVLLLVIVAGASVHWAQRAIAVVQSGKAPQDVLDAGQITDVAAVLDLAFVLPAFALTAVLLLMRRPMGFVLGPIILSFTGMIALLLVAIVAVLVDRGLAADYSGIAVSGGIAVIAGALLALFLRPVPKEA